MSTKIYNGYVLPKMSLQGIQNLTMHLRKKAEPLWENIFYSTAINIAISKMDRDRLMKEFGGSKCNMPSSYDDLVELSTSGKFDAGSFEEQFKRASSDYHNYYKIYESYSRTLLGAAMDEVKKRIHQIKVSSSRDPEVDPQFELMFIPMKDKTLALLYTEQKAFKKLWESTRGVKDYHYQNSTDKPNSISAKEWKQRRNNWEEVLGNSPPIKRGVIATIISDGDHPYEYPESLDGIKFRSFEDRVHEHAKSRVAFKRMEDTKDITERGSSSLSGYFESLEWLKTPEGEKQLNEMKAKIANILEKDITLELLTKRNS